MNFAQTHTPISSTLVEESNKTIPHESESANHQEKLYLNCNKFFSDLRKQNFYSKDYIPQELIYKALTRDVLHQWLGLVKDQTNLSQQQSTIHKCILWDAEEYIFKHLRKILSILILEGEVGAIIGFFNSGENDENLPFTPAHLEGIQKRHNFTFKITSFWKRQFEFSSIQLRHGGVVTLEPQEVLPLYDRILVGQGSFGSVYKVKIFKNYVVFKENCPEDLLVEDSEGHYFAWKEIKIIPNQDNSVVSYNRETFALKSLRKKSKTKNVVPLLGFFQQQDVLYIVFPFVRYTLETYMEGNDKPTEEKLGEFLQHASEMTHGLEAIHNPSFNLNTNDFPASPTSPNGGVYTVHCDLSPKNILLNGPQNFMIGDFGLAQFAENNGASSLTVGVHWERGKDSYSAPECSKDAPIGRAADVFALGAILLEVILYAIRGYSALRGFREKLNSIPGYQYLSSFHENNHLKPVVLALIKDLRNDQPINSRTINGFLDVVENMMNPNKGQRSKIGQCREQFVQLFQPKLPTTSPLVPPTTLDEPQHPNANSMETNRSGNSYSLVGFTSSDMAQTTATSEISRISRRRTLSLGRRMSSSMLKNNPKERRSNCIAVPIVNGVSRVIDNILKHWRSNTHLTEGEHSGLALGSSLIDEGAVGNNIHSIPSATAPEEILFITGKDLPETGAVGRSDVSHYSNNARGRNTQTVAQSIEMSDCQQTRLKSCLKKRETIFFLDDSIGVSTEEWENIIAAVNVIAPFAIPYVEDGIDVFKLSQRESFKLSKESDVDSLIEGFKDQICEGSFDLSSILDSHLSCISQHWDPKQAHPKNAVRWAQNSTSGFNLIIFTNGACLQSRQMFDEVQKILLDCAKQFDRQYLPRKYVGIQFVMVGGSENIWSLLCKLDDDLGSNDQEKPRDMIDATKFNPASDDHQYLSKNVVKVLLGGFDKGVDNDA